MTSAVPLRVRLDDARTATGRRSLRTVANPEIPLPEPTRSTELRPMTALDRADIAERPTAVYLVYDEAGAVIYIGISDNPEARLRGHMKSAPWRAEAASWREDWYANREQATFVEARRIAELRPVWNISKTDDHGPVTRRTTDRKLVASRRRGC